ncbi:MAG: serine O-acetyltransferase [Peptoniphilus sp.]|nr:serine O-acetyltransferase [Peptoniphilus sp.]MDY3118246.1 serine O-acetyltransferase [Peptoniphilus sp.]
MFFKERIEIARVILKKDPACKNLFEAMFCYPMVRALLSHRRAHRLYEAGHTTLARLLSHRMRRITGIEIHPGAVIGERLFIDHGMGVVIGETAEIGDDVTLYHGVTLGGRGLNRKKRHPTVKNGAMIGARATILGPVTIGEGSQVGAGAVVLHSVADGRTVVGIPAEDAHPTTVSTRP